MHIEYLTFSETGRRSKNDDYLGVVTTDNRTLFVLCDGLGGHPLGDMASRCVCEAVCDFWQLNDTIADSEAKLREAVNIATLTLAGYAKSFRDVGMGTTIVIAAIEGDKLLVAHCGDSRCYLFRNSKPLFCTTDHAGFGVLTRCLFSTKPEQAIVDIANFDLQDGDSIFLCSDGVWGAIAPNILADRLCDHSDMEQIVDVIKFLCEKYSNDNYSAIYARFSQNG